jgi:hypothetical protein
VVIFGDRLLPNLKKKGNVGPQKKFQNISPKMVKFFSKKTKTLNMGV